jgi:hypothetical protein
MDMRTIAVPLELMEEILMLLNDVENRSYGGRRWRTSYDLAAEVAKLLRSTTTGPDHRLTP